MQTILVIVALKVGSAQSYHLTIVPPEEKGNYNVRKPGYDDLGPLRLCPCVLRGQLDEPQLLRANLVVLGDVNGNEDADSDDGENEKHVAAHANEAQEDCGVHTNLLGQRLFASPPQSCYP